MIETKATVVEEVASYIASALRKPLPKEVVEKTKHHALDTIAAMVSGSRLLPGRRAIGFIKTRGGVQEASVVGSPIITTAENAALVNAMLAHADETDDSHAPSQTHPGCAIVPSALAMAERHGASGRTFLRAVALGYDIGTRTTVALGALEFREAGHATHAIGSLFGATAAAGALARLNERQVRHLLAYAAQQASGVGSWARDGEHIEKAFVFAGMGARNGVSAALMVASGFTGEEDAFSGDYNFFSIYGRNPKPQELVRELGSTYEIMNTNIKRWSVGSPIQAPLDSLLDLIRANSIRAGDIDKVIVRVSHTGARTTNNRTMPDISMQHMCAVMLVDGIVTFASSHDEKRMNDPQVQDIRRRIELVGDDALQAAMPSRQGMSNCTCRTAAPCAITRRRCAARPKTQ